MRFASGSRVAPEFGRRISHRKGRGREWKRRGREFLRKEVIHLPPVAREVDE